MIQQKVEIRFEKGEAVRFISHHDLMRALMRAVRRAQLPVRLTEGFNPRPRIVFPVALEVGVASLDEVAEIEFTQWLDIQDIAARLASAFPPGLTVTAVKALPSARTTQIPVRIVYRLHLAEAGMQVEPQAAAAVLAQTTLPLDRQRENRVQKVGSKTRALGHKPRTGSCRATSWSRSRPSPRGSARLPRGSQPDSGRCPSAQR